MAEIPQSLDVGEWAKYAALLRVERDQARALAQAWGQSARRWRKKAAWFEDMAWAGLAELVQRRKEIERQEAEAKVTDQLLETRLALVNAIPDCPAHGPQCVSHAVEWVENIQAKNARMREALEELLSAGSCDLCYEDPCDPSWCECRCHRRELDAMEKAQHILKGREE